MLNLYIQSSWVSPALVRGRSKGTSSPRGKCALSIPDASLYNKSGARVSI